MWTVAVESTGCPSFCAGFEFDLLSGAQRGRIRPVPRSTDEIEYAHFALSAEQNADEDVAFDFQSARFIGVLGFGFGQDFHGGLGGAASARLFERFSDLAFSAASPNPACRTVRFDAAAPPLAPPAEPPPPKPAALHFLRRGRRPVPLPAPGPGRKIKGSETGNFAGFTRFAVSLDAVRIAESAGLNSRCRKSRVAAPP